MLHNGLNFRKKCVIWWKNTAFSAETEMIFFPCFSSLCAAAIHFLSFDNTFTHYCTNFAQEFEIFYHLRDKYTDLLFGQSQTTLKFKMGIFLYFRWFLKWTRDLKSFDFFLICRMSANSYSYFFLLSFFFPESFFTVYFPI